jgi:molybdate transport system substrate-binding protein
VKTVVRTVSTNARRRVLVDGLVPLVALGVSACSSSGGPGSGSASVPGAIGGKITVYAASSLTEAFGTLEKKFVAAHPGTSVTFNFAASSDLGTQLNNGAKADVFASASTSTMADVTSAKQPVDFTSNKLEIATPPDNPAHVSSLADLAHPGLKVAVCDPAVPCGAVAQQVFQNAKITVKPAAQEPDVKSVVAAVESGEVDAGLIYVSDVHEAGSRVHGIPIPDKLNSTTTYQIAVLNDAPNAAAARAFEQLARSAAGRRVLTADGFGSA